MGNDNSLNAYSLGSAGISAAGGLLGGIVGAISNKKSQKRQYEYNSLLQQQAADLQNQSWFWQYSQMLDDQLKWREDERYYNSPTAQMQRMYDAGINPTFGNGGINTGNYSLNPEMPATSASVGSPGVGNYTTQFGNPLSEGVSQALAERGMRVQEKKVGIEENLSKAQIDEYCAKVKELLSQEKLNDESRNFIKEKIPLVQSQVDKNVAEVQQKWQGLLLEEMSINLRQELGYLENQRAIERNQAGFIEANAATSMAMNQKGQLALAREKWEKEVEFKGRELDNEAERLYQSFEKGGVEALSKAIDEASLKFNALGLRFTYTSPDDLAKQISFNAAVSRYFNDMDIEKIMSDNSGWTLHKGLIECYQKFNDLLEKMKLVQTPGMLPLK